MTPTITVAPDRLLFKGLLFLLFWAPLPFGSNRPWGAALLFLLAALLLMGWLLGYLTGRIKLPTTTWRNLRWPLVLLVLVQFWVWLQTLPLPRAWVARLSPRAAFLHLPAELVTLSVDPQLTRFHLLQGLIYTCGFCLMVLLVNQRERITAVLWTIVLSGSFQAAFGSLMTLSGVEYGFLVEKYSGLGVATGTFINRNHLAGYLVMCLAAGIGLLVSQLGSEPAHTSRERIRAVLKLLLSTKFRLRLLLALMVVGLVLTRSRMGNLSFFVSMTVAGGIMLLGSGRRMSGRVALLLLSLLLVDLFIVGQWFGVEDVTQRLVQTSAATESRDEVDVYSLGILQDYPWTGSGGGTFYTVFPHYSGSNVGSDYYVHAHNDYLEMAGDMGLPVFSMLVLLVIMALRRAWLVQYRTESRLDRGVSFAVLMVIGWVSIHSAVDFNLYIPANAFTFTMMLSMAWLHRGKSGKTGEIPESYVD